MVQYYYFNLQYFFMGAGVWLQISCLNLNFNGGSFCGLMVFFIFFHDRVISIRANLGGIHGAFFVNPCNSEVVCWSGFLIDLIAPMKLLSKIYGDLILRCVS